MKSTYSVRRVLIDTIGLWMALSTMSSMVHPQPRPIDKDMLRQHVAALAADSMEGRRSGSTGEQRAVKYLSLEFERSQIPPAGDHDSYLQPFYLRKALIYSTSYVQIGADTLHYPRDFSIFRVPDGDASWSSGLIYAGYGIHRPDKGIVSYESIDVKGRIAVVVSPEHWNSDLIPGDVRVSNRELASWAREQGAAGLIFLSRSSANRQTRSGERYVAAKLFDPFDTTGFLWIRIADGEQFLETHFPECSLSTPVPAKSSVSEVDVRSFMDMEPLMASNVIGILEGTDLKREHIVVTAHLDHLGIVASGSGDSIYNGAMDNATGVASMLEVARSIRRSGMPHRRSIMFVATSGEEQGLLGAHFFINHWTAQGEIVANVNLDMLGFALQDSVCWMTFLGGEYTDMEEVFERAARKAGVKIGPNLLPSFFYKGDGYAFARAGIPSINPGTGLDRRDALDGYKLFKTFYHRPGDELGRIPLSFDVLQQQTQTIAMAVWELANRDKPPEWTRSLDSKMWLNIRDSWGWLRMWTGKHLF